MIKEKKWRQMLYFAVGLITTVALLLATVVIPFVVLDTTPGATPERAVPAISIIAIVQLLIVAALLWTIKVDKRARQINKELLVASGIIPIVIGLIIVDGAIAYMDHPGMLVASISMFTCVAFDIIGGALAIIARYFREKKLQLN